MVDELVAPAQWGAIWNGRRARFVILAVTVGFSTFLVAEAQSYALASVGIAAGATLGCAALTVLERRQPLLGIRPVIVAIVVVFAVAVATPPRTSNDLWSYTMYGRTIAVHDASPYERVPADYPTDPLVRRVTKIWRHRSSVFGPVWVGYTAIAILVAGDSVLASRMWFQITAALAAAATLTLVWRRTRSAVALIWLGLHPLFGAIAVNGGHNDLVIAFMILASVMLFSRAHPIAGGVVIGLAALVKLTALLALIGLLVFALRTARRGLALRSAAAAGITVVLGYAPVFGSAFHVLSGADRTVTPASIWNPVVDVLLGHNSYRDVPHPLAPNTTLVAVSFVSLGCVALLGVLLSWRTAQRGRLAPTVGVATAAYPFAAEYTFPWYASWALPTFAEATPSPVGWVVWGQAALMLLALKMPVHWHGTILDGSVRVLLTYVAPIGMLIFFVAAQCGARTGGSTELRQKIAVLPTVDARLVTADRR
jgi:alpha-1,6-mannosyltransferase